MRIVFVRHGHPNYEKDCLTELGHVHAAAAAERLKNEGICEVHSSTCGRAVETAQYTADLLELSVIQHDFIREIAWGIEGEALYSTGHPWNAVDEMVLQGRDLTRTDWRETEPFCRNCVVKYADQVAVGLDRWLATLGYEREGSLYRVVGSDTDRTVAMFSHGGSSSAAIAHLFNLPFPYICRIFDMNYTAITIASLSDTQGSLTSPRLELANDSRHIQRCKNIISN